MLQCSIWFIGAPQSVEMLFDGAASGHPETRLFAEFEQAHRWLANSPQAPELIALAQSRPGEFTDGAIESLRRVAPLARVWRVLGTWCEGEGRSAPPAAGCTNAYWHQWPARWGRELARAERGELPSWTLPLTASPEERMLELDAEPLALGAGPLAVFASHPASAAALVDVCRLGGYDPTIVDAACSAPLSAPGEGEHRMILWDATPEQIADPAAIEKLRTACGPGPIVAVVGFARGDDVRRAATAGVAAVVTKPYLVHDLLWQLARVQRTGAA